MRNILAFIGLTLAAAPAAARDPIFALPIDCKLGESCFILNHMDADPGDGTADFACGPHAYNGHKGTDFAVNSYADMRRGVAVLAAAPGRVTGARDGMLDVRYGSPDAPDVSGKECGNGLVIDHGGGWETQYCHLKRDTLSVVSGQHVTMGQVLGHVGLSGKTQYPHLHISIRKNGQKIDPFDPDGIPSCGQLPPPNEQLWSTPIAYGNGSIITSGIAPAMPSYADVKDGTAVFKTLPVDAQALVGWSFVSGAEQGDVIKLRLEGPTQLVIEKEFALEKDQVLLFRATGKKARASWPSGTYTLQSWLYRDSELLDAHAATSIVE